MTADTAEATELADWERPMTTYIVTYVIAVDAFDEADAEVEARNVIHDENIEAYTVEAESNA